MILAAKLTILQGRWYNVMQGIKRIGNLPVKRAKKIYNRKFNELIEILAENTKNHFVKGFELSGRMTDNSQQGWQKRKPGTGTVRYNKNKKGWCCYY